MEGRLYGKGEVAKDNKVGDFVILNEGENLALIQNGAAERIPMAWNEVF
jgi:hypothetical protein